jgi:septum formation protein
VEGHPLAMTRQTFSPISRGYPLTLASASPRRKRLLTQIGIPFRSVASHLIEEDQGVPPETASVSLAGQKALEGYRRSGESWTLGADTLVVIGGKILGKPADEEDARQMLRRLSGGGHRVVTGFCILDPSGATVHARAVSTDVRFKVLTAEEIESYIRTGEPFGKAGGYAIQGVGAFLVEGISGSYTNVVGLPLCALVKALTSVRALSGFPLEPV